MTRKNRIMKANKTQKQAILDYLEMGCAITPMKALCLFSAFRLGAVIFKLKQEGHDIITHLMTDENGKRYASYSLVKP